MPVWSETLEEGNQHTRRGGDRGRGGGEGHIMDVQTLCGKVRDLTGRDGDGVVMYRQ